MKFIVGSVYQFNEGASFRDIRGRVLRMGNQAPMFRWVYLGASKGRLSFSRLNTLINMDITLSRTAAQRFVVKEGK